jgi:hypothetical protein
MSDVTRTFLLALRAQLVAMARMIDSHLKETEVTYTIGNLGAGPVKEEEDWGTGIDL